MRLYATRRKNEPRGYAYLNAIIKSDKLFLWHPETFAKRKASFQAVSCIPSQRNDWHLLNNHQNLNISLIMKIPLFGLCKEPNQILGTLQSLEIAWI